MGEDMHVSRRWSGDEGELEGCTCTVLECGHVSYHEANEKKCPQHCWEASRTIRRMHPERLCGDILERAWV